MNERIRLLALQAKLGPALLLHHYGTVDALTDTEQDELEQMEKFAELIVRECARSVTWYTKQELAGVNRGQVFRANKTVLEHFGVEE